MSLRAIVFLVLVGVTMVPLLRAPAAEKKDLVESIRAVWKERQSHIKAVTCSARVDSFYPKGLLTDMWVPGQTKPYEGEPLPKEDTRFTEESASWAIDFMAKNVRKEQLITNPSCDLTARMFFADYQLHLFHDGKYKLFRPKENYPKIPERSGILTPDVWLYEGASHMFLFQFPDLPLLWLGGGVNGQQPQPLHMEHIDNLERFSYRGEAQRKGHNCVVLSVPEGASKTAVREFWVGSEAARPIYYCCAREGKRVYWQLDVEYRDQDHSLVPAKWEYTQYNHPGELFFQNTYSVQRLEINPRLPADLFEKRLEPGQVAFVVEKNRAFEVDPQGRLVPLKEPPRKRKTTTFLPWVGVILALAVVFILAWRYFRKRAARS
jgi:hypothetical protein